MLESADTPMLLREAARKFELQARAPPTALHGPKDMKPHICLPGLSAESHDRRPKSGAACCDCADYSDASVRSTRASLCAGVPGDALEAIGGAAGGAVRGRSRRSRQAVCP